MGKVQRVRKVELWPIWKIALVASSLAALTSAYIITCIYFVAPRVKLPPWLFYVVGTWHVCVSFGLPASVIIRYHTRFRYWWHSLIYGMVYCYIAPFLAMAFSMIRAYLRWGLPTISLPSFIMFLIRPVLVSLMGAVLFTIVWIASRKSRGRLLITDRTFCPSCGYNLIGNTTYICPECGQPFTLEELEITEDDLKPVSAEPD